MPLRFTPLTPFISYPTPYLLPPTPPGGSTIFNGALGQGASRLQQYFAALPGVTPMLPG